MKLKITLIIIMAILVLFCILIYIRASESNRVISNQQGTIENLEELVNRKDFAWTAADMEIDNLEQTILSQEEYILELKVDQAVLELYKETLEYTLVWVHYAEQLMDDRGVEYFEYIGEQVLEDSYFEDLEDQVEVFEEVEK